MQRKSTNKLLAVALVVVFMLTLVVSTACNPTKNEHQCTHLCPICEKCTSNCTDNDCANKCTGHGNTTPPDGDDPEPTEDTEMASRRSFKLLAIGNSFSDNALQYMYPILDAFGVQEIVLGNLYIGGCTIETHAMNAASDASAYDYRKNTQGVFVTTSGTRMSTAFADEDWQYVTMQQASGSSGMINTYNAMIGALNDYVRDAITTENLKVAWHMTWAYQQNSTHAEFVNYDRNQTTMYNSIVNCVQSKIVPSDSFDYVIPAGTAIQNARTSYLGDTFTSDGYHLEGLGEFIAGLTYVAALTHWNLDEINTDKLPLRFMYYYDVAIEAVKNALENPFEVTQSKYTTDPDKQIQRGKVTVRQNVKYSDASNVCLLDIYLPEGVQNFDTVVHFHGGGLNSGTKDDGAHIAIAREVASRGTAFVSVNYRMYNAPTTQYGDFFVDGATAIKYIYDNIQSMGGNGKVYVSGQSAGAYIAMMLVFNKSYLENVGMKVTDVAGWLIESGQPTTHFEVLAQQGLNSQLQRVDEQAPMYYVDGSTRFNNMLLMAYTDDMACRLAQTTLLYKTILNFNPNAPVEFRTLYGQHCVNSTTAYRGKYPYADIVLDYLAGLK